MKEFAWSRSAWNFASWAGGLLATVFSHCWSSCDKGTLALTLLAVCWTLALGSGLATGPSFPTPAGRYSFTPAIMANAAAAGTSQEPRQRCQMLGFKVR